MTGFYVHMGMTGDRRVNVGWGSRATVRRELEQRGRSAGMMCLATIKAVRSGTTGRFLPFDRLAGKGRVS